MKKFAPLKSIETLSWVRPEDEEYRLAKAISRKLKNKEKIQLRKQKRLIKQQGFDLAS